MDGTAQDAENQEIMDCAMTSKLPSALRGLAYSTVNYLKKFPIYVREFGLVSGMRAFLAVEMAGKPDPSWRIRLSLPGYQGTIQLRNTQADRATFWQCLVQRQYDLARFPQYERLLKHYRNTLQRGETPLIIDCGGNIGLGSLWFGRLFPKAKIVSIEPDEHNFELLRSNTAVLGDRITLVQGGIWDRPGALCIVNPDSGSAAFQVAFSKTHVLNSISAYTIDDLCEIAGVANPLIVKLDIEGAQAHLFASNTEWVGRTALITLELDDWLFPWRGTSRNFFSCLASYPFDYLLGGESIFCFQDFGEVTGIS